jgi:carbon storage regulator
VIILTRKLGESITIGDNIKVTILGVYGRQIRLGVDTQLKITVNTEANAIMAKPADTAVAKKLTRKKSREEN